MADNDELHRQLPTSIYTSDDSFGEKDAVAGNRYTKLGMVLIVTQISPQLEEKITTAKPFDQSKRAFLEDLVARFLMKPGPLAPSYLGKDKVILRFWVSGRVHEKALELATKSHTAVAVIAHSALVAALD
ncbi:hypothetical protein RKE25_23385 (plasmid) [Dyella sp. BiH032]|uniref:hypothetical protein n=1 Tax=Dyella sp. BiH032 TaxID=3075430 RepID=UPI0028930579|nr:hypothetical protein [Dyella sp. BiH032]WNL48560.1 hypothetical protein RKE25_23385 [Dyella sp. BiH032]